MRANERRKVASSPLFFQDVVPTLLSQVVERPLSESRSVSPAPYGSGLISLLEDPMDTAASDLLLLIQALNTLTNVAALSDWHFQFKSSLSR